MAVVAIAKVVPEMNTHAARFAPLNKLIPCVPPLSIDRLSAGGIATGKRSRRAGIES
jgi:hypothetical protein